MIGRQIKCYRQKEIRDQQIEEESKKKKQNPEIMRCAPARKLVWKMAEK